MSNTQTKNVVIYFQSFDDTYQALTLLSHLILTCMSWLQQKEEDLHFLLSDNGNYNFDVKIIKCNLNISCHYTSSIVKRARFPSGDG